MTITHVSYERLELKLNSPYTIAYETVEQATNFILRVETNSRLVGYGCAAPDVVVTSETPTLVEQQLDGQITGLLQGRNPGEYLRILEELRTRLPTAASVCALVDMALLDLLAKKAQVPLYQLLGGYRHQITTSVTVGILPISETLKTVARYIDDGFSAIKVKGGNNVDEDIEKMKRLHAKHPGVTWRFDGNQGYSMNEALTFAQATDHLNLECLEQPLPVTQNRALQEVTQRVRVPVMADESLKTLDDAVRLTSERQVNMINIKLMKVGGIVAATEIDTVARAAGMPTMVGCVDECALGIAAGMHFALARPNVRYADLDGHLDFVNDPCQGLFHLKKGVLYPTDQAGLGEVLR